MRFRTVIPKACLGLAVVMLATSLQAMAGKPLLPFEQLPADAQQGIQILTTCSAAYGLFAEQVAKDPQIAEDYRTSSTNLLKMAIKTVGSQTAERLLGFSRQALLKQALSDTTPGLTLTAATKSCNDIVRSTFVQFFK